MARSKPAVTIELRKGPRSRVIVHISFPFEPLFEPLRALHLSSTMLFSAAFQGKEKIGAIENTNYPIIEKIYGIKNKRIISDLVVRSAHFSPLPGQESRSRSQKRPGANLPGSLPLHFRKETRGKRDRRAETAEVRHRKRWITAFLGEAHDFLPGQGTLER